VLDKIIKFSLTSRSLILGLALLVVGYGAYVAVNLPIDVFPNLNRPTVTIMIESGGLAPEEVETLVTFPVEVSVNGTPGLKRMRSSSGVGLSVIWLEFEWGTDIYRNRQLVAEKLNLVQEKLPEGIKPIMGPISSIMGEIQLIGLTSTNKDLSPLDLRTLADWTIRPRLLAISGISQIIPIGGGRKQYQILLNSEKLRERNLTLEDVEHNLSHISDNTTGGFVNSAQKEYLVRNIGRIESMEEIEESVAGSFQGRAVTVKEIATVQEGAQIKRGDASVNASPAVIMSVQKQPGTSTLKLTEDVQNALDEIRKALPDGVEIDSHLFKQADFIGHAVENVREALRDGAILVTIILFLFLLNLRTTFITLTAIPLSFAITAIVFKLFDLEINTMTLGGLAIAVGLVVDDAIVDVENVYRRLRENNLKATPSPTLEVIYHASKEIRSSIVFATLIVVLVFMPLFAMGGLEGRFFTPLGISFIVSLVGSLFVSLTVTPVLCYLLLPKLKNLKEEKEGKLVSFLKDADTKIVKKVLDKPWYVITPSIVLILISLCLLPFMSTEFLPKFNEGTAMISLILPPGVSLDYSNTMGAKAETIIKNVPEVKSVSRRTGRAELDEHAEGVNVSEIDVDFNKTGRSRQVVLNEIRDLLNAAVPGASVNLGQPISHRLDHLLSGVTAQIAIKIFGDDRMKLRSLASKVYTEMKDVKGIVDLQIEPQVEIPQIKVFLLREEAKLFNMNIGELASQLELALEGEVTAQVIEGQKIIDVFVRFNEETRGNIESIKKIVVKTMPDGRQVALEDVADIYEATGPNMINRENMQRRIVVQANTSDRGLSEVIADVRKNIDKNIKLPEGYFVRLEGQFESQQKAASLMLILGTLSMVAVFLLLYSHFKAGFIAVQIMLSVPLAVIGSIIAIFITDRTISIASMVAFITLCGIASRNGILMIDHYLSLMLHEGKTFSKEMVLKGSLERLVPVLMTTLSAILGLIPLLFSKGAPGKEILYPVAVVIVGGLVSSTILDMWVTPAVFYRFGRKSAEKYVNYYKNLKEYEL
jgi:Cu(I)/Ag(I) efflux system membrane protein CusA/SilA